MPFDSGGVWSLTPGYLAVTGQLILPSNHNPPLEDIAINGLSAVMVRDGRAPATGNWNMGNFRLTNLANGISANDAVNFSQLTALTASQGYIFGLTLANNALDVINDIDIAVGTAASSVASPYVSMNLASPLGKRLDAAWVVGGTPAASLGGLDTGAIANGTYHVYLIQRSDTGVVDACFSASATAPTIGGSIPAAYDRWRRIGSIIRAAGAIRVFQQYGDIFNLRTPVADRSSTAGFSSALLTLTVPSGIVVKPILSFSTNINAGANFAAFLGDASSGQAYATIAALTSASAYNETNFVPPVFSTNTISQLYYGCQFTGTIAGNVLTTNGWVDHRGRLF